MYHYIKQKIENGRLQELYRECKWVARYVVRYRGAVATYVMLGIIGIVMSLGSSVASKFLIDAVIGYNNNTIVKAFSIMLGMRVGHIVMRSVASLVGAKVNIRIQNEIQVETYQRILKTDWQSLEGFRSGDLLNRLGSDTNTVAGAITSFIPSLVANSVQLMGSFFIILYYDPVMAMIALLSSPLTVICSSLLLQRMRKHNREMKDLYSNIVSFQQDSFQNITVIKAFGVTDWFGGRMENIQQEYKNKFLDYNNFSVKTSAVVSLLSLVCYFGCFGWGVYHLWMGRISYGEMTMFLQLSGFMGSAFSGIVGLVPAFISIATSAGRVMAVVELPQEDTATGEGFDQETSFTLKLEDVSFQYEGGITVLDNLSLEAKPGELISITGPSGEGKTTLLRIILGLVNSSKGDAFIIGNSGRKYHLSAATRSAFGYVPQGNHIFTGTIAENLRISNPDATEDEMINALKIACAYDFVMDLPDGLDHMVGGRDKRLSEGQAQRIALARAILKNAPILLLDEATSALDMETESQLLTNLMNSGIVKTCILVTHRPAGKQLCNRNYHISDGSVAEVD